MTFWFRNAFTWWWVISYLGYLKVHFTLIKYTCDSKSQTLHIYICTTRSSPPADRFHTETGGRFAFTWYRCDISYWSEILAGPSATIGVNLRRGESHLHEILWWYHVKRCRAMRRNRSELTPARKSPRCHVNTPLSRIALLSTLSKPGTGQWRKWLADSDLFRRNEWKPIISYLQDDKTAKPMKRTRFDFSL